MDASTILKKYETAVYMILITLFAIIVAFSIGELVYILYQALFISTPCFLKITSSLASSDTSSLS